LALNAIAFPRLFAELVINPLNEKSNTFKLLHYPNEDQNNYTKLVFKLSIFLAKTTSTVVVIFNIL
jgi:hypothetical protein